ncbi:MAG: hypothetical protein HYR56_27505 [Acidobacteria bacterium]|nr:hypothetical protein [Acidobacteriota bacterium]MBI3424595.1 hypothetical protein [Acidobacteriota bacterium]
MFRQGRRLFSAASICLLITALLHTLGNLSLTPMNDAEAAVLKAMREFTLAMGMGMVPSFLDIFRDLTFTMSVTVVVWGMQNLLAAKHGSDRLLKPLTWLNVLGVGALVVMNAVYRVPPPLICFSVVEVLFLLSLFSKGSTES